MATLTISDIDDTVYERLQARAAANNRSLEAEVCTILYEATRDWSDTAAEHRASQPDRGNRGRD